MAKSDPMWSFRVPELMAQQVDLERGAEPRSRWLLRAIEGMLGAPDSELLESPARVSGLPVAPVLRGTVRRVPVSEEIELPPYARKRPVDSRSSLAAVRDRPAKQQRLAVARSVKSSAEAKAGVVPVDWRVED